MRYFLKITVLAVILLISSCKKKREINHTNFHVNLLDLSDDTFKVTVTPPTLNTENNIFQFAVTAPGAYQVMDIGRFVKSFKAFDKNGNELATEHISTNQFELSSPEKIAKITYQIAETWDTPVEENKVYRMCGTSIEEDHVLINPHAVFGYFKGKQASPIHIQLEYPNSWQLGTALDKNKGGTYVADTYDHLVDSPILTGNLTKASIKIKETNVNIYTYSKTGLIQSSQILESVKNILSASSDFIGELPVKNYTFLYHFEDKNAGAWEHSYSSFAVEKEELWSKKNMYSFLEGNTHEFFHIITPLNLHSEIIEQFNFVTPVPSKHLWLYEGVTSWAGHLIPFRSKQTSKEEYFKYLSRKVDYTGKYAERFGDSTLVAIALNSYTPKGSRQYGNIYQKGNVVAGLLHIRLLELSDGKKGLMDVVNALTQKYGTHKPFSEDDFFEEFTNATGYPEIRTFIADYIESSKSLPIKEYYSKIGVDFNEDTLKFSMMEHPTAQQQKLKEAWMKPLNVE